MDDFHDIRQIWGGALAPLPSDLITAPVSELTRRALTELGLPVADPLEFTFYHDDRVLGRVTEQGRDFFVLGAKYGIPFGIAADGDAVYRVYPASTAKLRFVNSTLVDFLYCYGLFCRELPELRTTTERAARAIGRRLREQISARDPAAMVDGHHMWPSLLGAAERGEV